MRLSKPRMYTWIIGIILFVLAILGHEGVWGSLSSSSFWLAEGGLGLMLVASLIKGL